MSVMTQSHEFPPLAAKNSSADANPRARYPSEQSESTSASRNGSSSSMTAIKGSLDTHHPRVWVRVGGGERAVVASGRATTTLYRGVTQRLRGLGLDYVGHPHEVSQCPCAHLAHGGASMNFRSDLAYSKFSRHLFVHLPGCHQHHHLLFARGQCSEPLSHLRSIVVGSPPLAVAFDGHHHANAGLGQLGLELEPAHIGQADVDNDASRLIRKAGVEKVASRSLGSGVKSHRVEQALQRAAQRSVVVDHVHDRPIARLERHWCGPHTVTSSLLIAWQKSWCGSNQCMSQPSPWSDIGRDLIAPAGRAGPCILRGLSREGR